MKKFLLIIVFVTTIVSGLQAQTINFNLLVDTDTTINTLPPVKAKSFDWRKAHGANLNTSPYFDGNPDYGTINIENTAYLVNENNGWLTSVKDMHTWGSCPNGCYLFAPIGSLEAVINLYFNQHLDYNISEQHLADCFNVYSPTSLGQFYQYTELSVC